MGSPQTGKGVRFSFGNWSISPLYVKTWGCFSLANGSRYVLLSLCDYFFLVIFEPNLWAIATLAFCLGLKPSRTFGLIQEFLVESHVEFVISINKCLGFQRLCIIYLSPAKIFLKKILKYFLFGILLKKISKIQKYFFLSLISKNNSKSSKTKYFPLILLSTIISKFINVFLETSFP